MQEIIKNKQSPLNTISPTKFYGIDNEGAKQFVLLNGMGCFAVVTFENANRGYSFESWGTLEGLISKQLAKGFDVFEFKNSADLFKWSLDLENKGKSIKAPDKNTILLEDITQRSEGGYFGVTGRVGREKSFVTQEGYHKGKFKAVCQNGLTYGNYFSDSESDSLNGCIKELLEAGAKVFKFCSAKDLFAWLAQ